MKHSTTLLKYPVFITLLTMLTPAAAQKSAKTLSYDTLTRCSTSSYYYEDIDKDFACVSHGKQKGYINHAGELIFPFEKYSHFIPIDDSHWFVKKADSYGAIDIFGNELIPFKYYYIIEKSPHFFAAKFEEKGKDYQDIIVYQSGKLITKPKCSSFEAMYDDKIGVCKHTDSNTFWRYFIDSQGNQGKEKYKYINKVENRDWFTVSSYKDNRVGIVDFKQQTIVPAEYAEIKVLDNGFIAYKNQRGYWGLMDRDGKKLVKAQYDEIKDADFSDKFIQFNLDGRNGFLNLMGKEVIPPKYKSVLDYSESKLLRLIEANGKEHFLTDHLKPIKLPKKITWSHIRRIDDRLLLQFPNEENYRLVDLKGDTIIPPKYDSLSIKDGFLEATRYESNYKYTGIIDKHGKVIVPIKDQTVERQGDFFIARIDNAVAPDTYTVYTQQGEVLLKPQVLADLIYHKKFNVFLMYEKELGKPYSKRYMGYVDTSGKINRINFWKYKYAWLSNAYLDHVFSTGKKIGVIDRNGKVLLPFEYKELLHVPGFDEKLFFKKDTSSYGVITRTGKIIMSPRFEEIKYIETTKDETEVSSIVQVKEHGKWGLYDLKTDRIVLPTEYDNINSELSNEKDYYFTEVRKADKVGIVDIKGKIVLPAKYDKYTWIFNGEMIVGYNNDQWQDAFDLSGTKHFSHAAVAP